MGSEFKVFLKWGLIIVGVLVAWRWLSGVIGGLGNSQPTGPVPSPSQFYYQGVWAPYMIPMGNPFYQSTNGGHRPRRA